MFIKGLFTSSNECVFSSFVFLPLSSMRSTSCGCSTSRWDTWNTPTDPTLPISRTNWECQWSCVTQQQTRSVKFLLHLRWKESHFQIPQRPLLLFLFLLLQASPRLMFSTCATRKTPSASPTSSTCPPAPCPCSATLATTPTAPHRKFQPQSQCPNLLHLHQKSPPHLHLHQSWSKSLPQPPSAPSRAWNTTVTPIGTPTAWLTIHPDPWRGRSWSPHRHLLLLPWRKRKRSQWRSLFPSRRKK